MKTLPDNFYVYPHLANTVMTHEDLKELLLETGGTIIASGRLYDIESKLLGAGIYRVTLKRWVKD